MFFVGLTGGIASGKSTVTQMFIDHGLPVVDADSMAKKVVEPGRKAWRKLKKEFGEEIFDERGYLNREKLGSIIFADKSKRRKLNSITHPEIMKEMIFAAIKVGLKGYPFVILDIPLLYETGELVKIMHKTIVVNCLPEQQTNRLMERNKLSLEQVNERIKCQMPLDEKCQMADFVIDNSSSLEDTKAQVERIIRDLKHLKFHYKIRFYMFLGLSALTFSSLYVLSIFTK